MNQALTFILKLQDMLTPGMRQAARISNTSAGQIQGQFDRIAGGGKRMSASVDELRARLDAINKVRFGTTMETEFKIATIAAKKLQKQIEELENTGNEEKKKGGILGAIVGGNLISSLIGKAGDFAMGAAGSVISGSIKREQDKVGLTTFLGKDGATEAYNNIQKDAAVTPFDTQSLLTVNRALISAGLNAKDARRDAMNLANAISATGGGNDELQRMAMNMQQIKTVGKASAMDIKQFAFAGINIYELLARATGKNVDQVKEMDVSYGLLSKALQQAGEAGGLYAGALEKQGQTMGAKWATFMDKLSIKAADIGDKLSPIFNFILDKIVALSEKFDEWMPYLQPVFDLLNSIPQIIADITSPTSQWSEYLNVAKNFIGAVWTTIKSLALNVWNIVKGLFDWIGKSQLIKDLFWAIGKFGEAIMWAIRQIGDVIQWIWEHLIRPILDKIEWVYSKIKGLFGGGKTEIVVTDGTAAATKAVAIGAGTGQPFVTTAGVFGQFDAAKSGLMPAPPGTAAPGVNPLNLNADRSSKVTAADLAGAGGTKSAKSKSESINSGGQRSIVINIAKVMDKIEQHIVGSGQQAADEFAGAIREALRRELNSLNGVAS